MIGAEGGGSPNGAPFLGRCHGITNTEGREVITLFCPVVVASVCVWGDGLQFHGWLTI